MAADLRPRCPRCGEPARSLHMTARVKCELQWDGTPGKITHVGRREAKDVAYVCGGNHRWKSDGSEVTGEETPAT